MIAKVLVFACAAFGIVAGSCIEVRTPQEYSSQIISVPVQSEASYSSPALSEGVFSSCGSSDLFSSGSAQIVSAPVENVYTSVPVVVGEQSSPVVQVSGSSLSELLSSGSSGSSLSDIISSGVEASNGPESTPVSVFQAPAVTLPAVEGPIVSLSSQPIPAPKVLSQRCICTKTVVKPQIIQRTVTVPRIQRYLKRTVTPVVENIAYRSTPVSQESSGSGSYIMSGSGSSGSSVLLSGSGSGSQTRYISSPVSVSSGCSSQRYY